MSERVELLAALHWRIVPPFAQDNPQLGHQADVLGRCVAAQVRAVTPPNHPGPIDLMLCSTVISSAVTGMTSISERLSEVIKSECQQRPVAHLHTYMCAGWGYALSYFLRYTDARLVMLSIVDVDLHDMAHHHHHVHIGKQGFAITTVLLELPLERIDKVRTGGPFGGSAFKEFVLALRQHNDLHKPTLSFIPFFGAALSSVAEKIIGVANLGANRHEDYGHCFGSDPWIGMIEWLQRTALDERINVSAGMVALSGYFALCNIGLSPQTRIGSRVVSGRDSELESSIAAGDRLCTVAELHRKETVNYLNRDLSYAS
jgi:hypothetical protein